MSHRWSGTWRRRKRQPYSHRIYLAISVSCLILALCWLAYAWYVADRDLLNPLPGYAFGIGWTVVGVASLRKVVLLRRKRIWLPRGFTVR